MKPILISSVAALAVLGLASAASASTTYDINPAKGVATTSAHPVVNVYDLSPLIVSTSPSSVGSTFAVTDPNSSGKTETFVSDFIFDVGSLDSVGASADFTFTSKFGVSGYTLALYSGSPTGANALVPTTTSGFNNSSYDAILKPGAYFVQTDVTVPKSYSAGKYDVQVVASAVSAAPEPAAWTLMIAGVAMAGGLLRARRNAGASLNLA